MFQFRESGWLDLFFVGAKGGSLGFGVTGDWERCGAAHRFFDNSPFREFIIPSPNEGLYDQGSTERPAINPRIAGDPIELGHIAEILLTTDAAFVSSCCAGSAGRIAQPGKNDQSGLKLQVGYLPASSKLWKLP
jgi:hypothetical protein